MKRTTNRAWRVVGGGMGAAALLGIGHLATTWYRYGRAVKRAGPPTLLDRFVPEYEVCERHETQVDAPVEWTYAAARGMDLMQSPIIRAIFRGRELLMGAIPTKPRAPQPLVDEVLAIGWGMLAEETGRELVLGAVTEPWEAEVKFRSLPPDEFAAFDAPGFAKIAWVIRADPLGPAASRFSTETRVTTTDAEARRRFRRYWTMVSPGVRLIRRESLRLVRSEAEWRYRADQDSTDEGVTA